MQEAGHFWWKKLKPRLRIQTIYNSDRNIRTLNGKCVLQYCTVRGTFTNRCVLLKIRTNRVHEDLPCADCSATVILKYGDYNMQPSGALKPCVC